MNKKWDNIINNTGEIINNTGAIINNKITKKQKQNTHNGNRTKWEIMYKSTLNKMDGFS